MKKIFSFLMMIIILSSCQKVPGHQLKSLDYKWKPFSQQALQEAIAHHKPVIIDCYADWCPICHELDKDLFSLPEVQAQLSQVIALRFDATNQDDPDVQKIIQQYNIDGLPTIIFLDSRGLEINNSRIIGYVTSSDFSQAFALINLFK